jgi:phosphate transport system ATP-binding protein
MNPPPGAAPETMTTTNQRPRTMSQQPPPTPGSPPESVSPEGMEDAARVKATRAGAPGRRVSIQGLDAWYGDNHVVKNLDMKLAPNEVTAIIGPSGCGKSTLVRCVNRMHEETAGARASGSVLLDDLDLYGDELDVVGVRRAVGMVFQKPTPFPTMSIFENVACGPRLTGIGRRELPERVHRALRDAALWEEVKNRLEAPATGLSGGQQQRLCIARALAVEPEVLLMDEPCSALDPVATLRVEELITELKERVTIGLVTHNMQEAARVADTTAFMLDGELVEMGPTEGIFTRPHDERTEDYVSGKFG